MNKKYVLFFFPTNKQGEAFKYALSSLKHIECMLDRYDVGIGIVGQGKFVPFAEEAKSIILSHGFEFFFQETEERNPVHFLDLRQRGANLKPDADYYILIDDNCQFTGGTAKYPKNSGTRYLQALDYLEGNPDCGMVNCCGSLGGNHHGEDIRLYETGKIVTLQRGDVYRNFHEGRIFPDGVEEWEGGMDEIIYALWCNLNHYYVAKQFNNPTRHYDMKQIISFKDGTPLENDYPDNNGLHLSSLAEKWAFDWIRENLKSDYKFGDKIINLDWRQKDERIFRIQ